MSFRNKLETRYGVFVSEHRAVTVAEVRPPNFNVSVDAGRRYQSTVPREVETGYGQFVAVQR